MAMSSFQRKVLILGVCIAVLAGTYILGLVFSPARAGRREAEAPLIAGFERQQRERVAEIRLRSEEGQRILQKRGDSWVLPGAQIEYDEPRKAYDWYLKTHFFDRAMSVPVEQLDAIDGMRKFGDAVQQFADGWGEVVAIQKDDEVADVLQKGTLTAGSARYFDGSHPGYTDSNPTVIYDGVQYHMWYSGVQGDYMQGGYATSPDGTNWTKYFDNPVLPVGLPGSWDELHARPGAVVADGDTLKMWYTGLGTSNHVQIGYAESVDGGITWIKHPEPVLEERFDAVWDQRVSNPSVILTGSTYHMWYAGYNVPTRWWRTGYVYSPDGIHWNWTRHDGPVVSVAGNHTIASPVIYDGSTWHMWYGHYTFDFSLIASSYATSTCCEGLFADDFETGDTSLWTATVP